MLLLLNCSSSCRAVCSLFSNFLVSLGRLAPCSTSFRAVCSLFFQLPNPFRNSLFSFLLLKFSSSFRAVCSFLVFNFSSLCRNSPNSHVSFEWFAPSSEMLEFLSSGLLFLLNSAKFSKFSNLSLFRADGSNSLVPLSSLLLVFNCV